METTAPTPTGGFATLGRLCARHRRRVILAWAAVAVALGVFAPGLGDRLSPGGFEIAGSPSERARTLIQDRFSQDFPSNLTAVLTVRGVSQDPTAELRRAGTRLDAIARAQGAIIGRVGSLRIAPDQRTAIINIGLSVGLDEALRGADELLAALRRSATPTVGVELTGGAAIFTDFDRVNEQDLRRAELIQVPLVLLILLLVLGSLIAAGVPIVTTAAALVVTLGGLYFVARVFDLSIYVQNIVPLVGIGVGVDYSLFLVSRFREELAAGRTVADAVIWTTHTSGRAIFYSGLTVAVALAGMFAVGVPIFTGFAIGSIAVVAVAVATALTLVPAVLATIGRGIFRLPVPGTRVRRINVDGESGNATRWTRWAEVVMRHPWRFVLAASALLLVLASPALRLSLGSSGSTALPRDVPSIRAADAIAELAGPGALAPIRIVVDARRDPVADTVAGAFRERILRDPAVVTAAEPRRSDDARAVLIDVISRYNEDDVRAHRLVERIERTIVPGVSGLGDQSVYVGGAASQNRDFNATVARNLPRVIGLVMALTFLVLMVLFRSLLLPLKAVAMTLLSVVASYGVLVAVFQWGWGDGLLGFEHLGHVTAWVPVFLFSILFGLSMDYEVFLLSRVREHRVRHGDDRAAVAWGLSRSGGIITAAAAIMIVVFAAFLTNRLIPLKEASLGLGVAVLLDATIVRVVLVPAFMRLAGRWNWWLPRWLDRLLPQVDHHERT